MEEGKPSSAHAQHCSTISELLVGLKPMPPPEGQIVGFLRSASLEGRNICTTSRCVLLGPPSPGSFSVFPFSGLFPGDSRSEN